MEGVYFFAGLIALILIVIVSRLAGGIAEDKGYEGNTWFWICLLLPFGVLLVVALPDRKLRVLQNRTNELLQILLEKMDNVGISQNTSDQKETGRYTFDDLPNI